MKKKIYLILTFLICASICHAQYAVHSFRTDVTKVGTTAGAFLTLGVGARANAMGGAFVSIADDVTSLYWNPAGLGQLSNVEMTFTHNEWIADLKHDFIGAAIPLGIVGVFGFQINMLSMDEMDVTTPDFPDGTGEKFDGGDMSLGLSYARGLTDRLSVGATVKYIESKLWHMKANAVALDIGVTFSEIFDLFQLGACISNYGTKMHYYGRDNFVYHDIRPAESGNNEKIDGELQTKDYNIPTAFQVGISTVLFRGSKTPLVLAVELYEPSDNVRSLNIGTEWGFYKRAFLRTGYNSLLQDDTERGLTFGGGLNIHFPGSTAELQLDYCWEEFGLFDNTQKISASFRF